MGVGWGQVERELEEGIQGNCGWYVRQIKNKYIKIENVIQKHILKTGMQRYGQEQQTTVYEHGVASLPQDVMF